MIPIAEYGKYSNKLPYNNNLHKQSVFYRFRVKYRYYAQCTTPKTKAHLRHVDINIYVYTHLYIKRRYNANLRA